MLRILADQLDPSHLLSSLFRSLIETDSPPIQIGSPPDQIVTRSVLFPTALFYCRTHPVLMHPALVWL